MQNKSFGMAAIYARVAGMRVHSAVQTIQLFQGRVQLIECAFDGVHPALLIGREPARRVVSIALTVHLDDAGLHQSLEFARRRSERSIEAKRDILSGHRVIVGIANGDRCQDHRGNRVDVVHSLVVCTRSYRSISNGASSMSWSNEAEISGGDLLLAMATSDPER